MADNEVETMQAAAVDAETAAVSNCAGEEEVCVNCAREEEVCLCKQSVIIAAERCPT